MTKIGITALLLAVMAVPAAAQQDASQESLNDSVRVAMETWVGGRYNPPECDALSNTGHFKVSSGRTYLSSAITGTNPANTARQLRDAKRVITEAITQNDRGKSASAWYFLGWVDLMRGDVAGGDSSLAKAEALAPQCAAEIDKLRGIAYIGLVNPGIGQMKAHHDDSAAVLFRQASDMAPKKPEAPYYLATIAYNAGKMDTAVAYFERAAKAAAGDSSKAELTNKAKFFGALGLLQLNRPKEAIPLLHEFIKAQPDEPDGKKALVNAYRAAGMADSATALEKELIKSGALSADNGAPGGASDAYNVAVERYNAKKYDEAAQLLTQLLTSEPNNHDALSLAANTYLALKNGAKLAEVAKQLTALEPLNENAQKFLAEGYRETGDLATRTKVVNTVLGLPVDLRVSAFTPSANGATLAGTATGRDALTPTGTAIKPKAVTVTFEFLDKAGNPVASQNVTIPALAKGETHDISVQAQGAGIVSWRYSVAGGSASGK
jgi:tetratricopeptide (TPR) repeat protein